MKHPPLLSELAKSIGHMLLPRLCEGCQRALLHAEEVLCMGCLAEIPQTGFHDQKDNEAALRLAGRIPYRHASSFAWFTPDGLLQHLLHRLKYAGRRDIGVFLGKQAGYALRDASWIGTIDSIVPVPLHMRKQAVRGFNQAAMIANGMRRILNVPVLESALIRSRPTESQTRKSREERVANVADAFALNPKALPVARHLLLIDDVLTTGATLEAAALPLLGIPGMDISILSIALATL